MSGRGRISPFTFRVLRVFRGSPFLNSKSKNSKLVALLLDWFAANARDLPWRRTRDPYAIWASEIMLQQTQVKTVIPYWERWLRELPSIESLAHASADKIHKLWEGLGYYTRVRNMQKAAQQIVSDGSSRREEAENDSNSKSSASLPRRLPRCEFPQTFDAVLALPGIGRYTAGAICSIAFNQPTPILDGNVIRVLTRIYGIKTDPREKQTNARLWQLAEELVTHASRITHHASANSRTRTKDEDERNCSHFNQSLMELGALVCTPRSPNCAACPVQKLCVALKENLQDQLPNLAKRETATERRFLAFVVERDGKFLVRQRPAGVVNAHLWEFPNVEAPGAPSSRRRVTGPTTKQHAGETLALPANGLCLTTTKPLCTIKHSITRYRITLEAWRAELVSGNGAPVSDPARSKSAGGSTPDRPSSVALLRRVERPALHDGEWRTLAQLHKLAFTSAHKKILARLSATQYGKPRR
jgi:A/G-specific adenine glycosylase